MELSRHSPTPTRYTGIGLVIAVHLVAIWALNVAFLRPTPPAKHVTEFKPLPPEVREHEPPPPPLKPTKPVLSDPQVIPVPIPDWTVEQPQQPPLISGVPLSTDPGPTTVAPRGNTQSPPPTISKPEVQRPGAVCSVMPRPELPMLNWSGEAVLQVVATVRGGRVVGSEFRVTQGALDSKSRRALQRSVESALAGYQCQGDAMFQQDFAFRLD